MYDVLSPDGISITADRVYPTLDDAKRAAEEFSRRFVTQGFYSTASRERIPVDEIVGRCRVVPAECVPWETDCYECNADYGH